MRIKSFVIFFCVASLSNAFAQTVNGWKILGTDNFWSAQYLTDEKILVVGTDATIKVSTDGGQRWNTNKLPGYPSGLQSVSFIDSLHGLIAGIQGEVFSTSDGGLTWAEQTKSLMNQFGKLVMVSKDTAYACGSNGSIFRSGNGGKNWDSLSSRVPFFLQNLYFINTKTGFVVGDSGTLLKTTNAGNSWIAIPLDTNVQLLGIDFCDNIHGAICGELGFIFITSDGGMTWQRKVIPGVSSLRAITMHSSLHLSAAAYNEGIFESNDTGSTWTAIQPPTGIHGVLLLDMGFRKEKDRGWAVGYEGAILTSVDSGMTWVQNISYPLSNTTITDMHFFDSNNGYAVGGDNIVLRTSDGGDNWKSLVSGASMRIYSIFAPSPDTVFLAGWNLFWLLKTNDGWKTWYSGPAPTIDGMQVGGNYTNEMSMVNRNLGYIVQDSIIWRTVNGCTNWNIASIWNTNYYTRMLTHINFPSENVGYALGYYSILLDTTHGFHSSSPYYIMFRTRDGGVTWDTLDFADRKLAKQNMYFWDNNNGIVLFDNGDIMKTSDGGDTWRQSAHINGYPNSINFYNRKVGYIAASTGKVFLTTDGGETWSLDLDLTKISLVNGLVRIVFPDSNTVMASGFEAILKKKINLTKLAVEKIESASIDHYAWITLKQNPVKTTLSCKLYWISSQPDAVSLKIYNILGIQVQDLSEELRKVNSTFGMDLDANVSNLSSGVYMLALNAGGSIKSQPFIIAK